MGVQLVLLGGCAFGSGVTASVPKYAVPLTLSEESMVRSVVSLMHPERVEHRSIAPSKPVNFFMLI